MSGSFFIFFLKCKLSICSPLLLKGLCMVPGSSCQILEAFSMACQEKQVWSGLPWTPALGINGSLCSPSKSTKVSYILCNSTFSSFPGRTAIRTRVVSYLHLPLFFLLIQDTSYLRMV